MRIVIVGIGKIGRTILSALVSEGHDVVAIDGDPKVISDITNMYDVIGVCGNGNDCDTLEEAGVDKAELFIAVTGSDEFNMLSCFLAKGMGTKHTIARIRNPEYNKRSLGFMCQQLDISMAINPERLAAREIHSILRTPAAAKIESFSRRNFEIFIIRLKNDSKLDGMSLVELRKKYQAKFLVCAVQRGDKVYIPDGDFILKSGDKIGLTAPPNEMQKLFRMMDMAKKKAKSVMIIGASKTAYYLAKMLLEGSYSVKIIDQNKARCEEFCEKLPDVTMIHGDAVNEEVLIEEGIKSVDAFVALTGIDEANILLSSLASSMGVPKVIAKVNRDEFAAIAENLGIESLVSPRIAITDVLVRYARALQNSIGSKMETLYTLMDEDTEALEFIVTPDCKLIDIPLKDLKTKKNVIIAGIIRGRKTIIPTGDDVILPDDRVIVIASGIRVNDLMDII